MMTQDHALEEVLINWDNLELTVEVKLNSLRDYILKKAGLDKSVEYYQKEGKMLERYAAGFINRYFMLLKDVSFLLLDPLHILDIIWSFIKNIFRHPLKTVKRIWEIWTGLYKLGAYGVGMVTADALLAAIIAGVGLLLKGGQVLEVVAETATTFAEKSVGAVTGFPKKMVNIAQNLKATIDNFDDIVRIIQQKPDVVLCSAQECVAKDASFGGMRKYKLYSSPFRKRDTLT